MKKKFDLIFMGTPDFAVPSLEALHRSDHPVELVVTQPDRPKGRGRKPAPPPVKTAALKMGLDVLQPENVNDPAVIDKLAARRPDMFIVAAFGQKLSGTLLAVPAIYPVNIHASLLPEYRGASPIQAAILNMDDVTGVTTIVMEKSLDTGDILLSGKTEITPADTAGTVHDRLAQMGADLVVRTLDGISRNTVTPFPQDHELATYAPMLKKRDGKINWSEPAEKICARIRAMTPWPGAYTTLDGETLKIFNATPSPQKSGGKPGTIIRCGSDIIEVAAGKNCVRITELMGKSGKRLDACDFLCGSRLSEGMAFDN